MVKATRGKLEVLLGTDTWGDREEAAACDLPEKEFARVQDCAHKGLKSGVRR
jgi:hypothetical protein